MRRSSIMLGILGACFGLISGVAQADRVHLVDGAVIEGKATRQGNKVVIELESGQVTLAAGDVAKIESGSSPVQRFEQLETEQRGRGVAGLMVLADYCRDHGMRARERTLLQSVLEQQPDHADARARLGFVKSDAGWITREEQLRAQGFVQDGGEFITREQLAEREQRRAEADAAKHEREKAKLEVEQQKVALERERLELARAEERAAEAEKAAAVQPTQPAYLVYGAPYANWHDCHQRSCRNKPPRRNKPFPIPGVRDPRDTSWPIAGVKDPARRSRSR
jgi:hypothetical protein